MYIKCLQQCPARNKCPFEIAPSTELAPHFSIIIYYWTQKKDYMYEKHMQSKEIERSVSREVCLRIRKILMSPRLLLIAAVFFEMDAFAVKFYLQIFYNKIHKENNIVCSFFCYLLAYKSYIKFVKYKRNHYFFTCLHQKRLLNCILIYTDIIKTLFCVSLFILEVIIGRFLVCFLFPKNQTLYQREVGLLTEMQPI